MQKVIVVGADHYNTLGVIRLSGEYGIRPTVIFTEAKENNSTALSKYIDNAIYIEDGDEEKVITALLAQKNDNEKAVIIPTGDPAAVMIDRNLNKLRKYFIVPNLSGQEGGVLKMMDKMEQYKLCLSSGIRTANTWAVNEKNYGSVLEQIPDKVIIKPIISAVGKKSDIVVSSSRSKTESLLRELFASGYKSLLVQEFVEYDREQSAMGIAVDGEVVIPGIVSKKVLTKNSPGTSSYGEIIPLSEYPYNIDGYIRLMRSIKYTGLFEIEFFVKGEELFFNELNLRNSANVYAFMGDKVNYIGVYLSLLAGRKGVKRYITRKIHYCQDILHIKNAKKGDVSPIKAVWHIASSTKLVYNRKDRKPYIGRIINKIKKVNHG